MTDLLPPKKNYVNCQHYVWNEWNFYYFVGVPLNMETQVSRLQKYLKLSCLQNQYYNISFKLPARHNILGRYNVKSIEVSKLVTWHTKLS